MRLTKIVPAHRVTMEFRWVQPDFSEYIFYREARAKVGLKVVLKCQWCASRFADRDMLALAQPSKGGNILLCQKCAQQALQGRAIKQALNPEVGDE